MQSWAGISHFAHQQFLQTRVFKPERKGMHGTILARLRSTSNQSQSVARVTERGRVRRARTHMRQILIGEHASVRRPVDARLFWRMAVAVVVVALEIDWFANLWSPFFCRGARKQNVGSLFETVQARWEENRGIADSSARRQPAGVTAAATLFVTRDALDTWPRARRAVIKKGSTSQTACFGNLLT